MKAGPGVALVTGFLVFWCLHAVAADGYGLDHRDPVAPFWHGHLPSVLPDRNELSVVEAFPHLTFSDPIGVVPEPGSRRLFVYTRQGSVFAIENDPEGREAVQMLDIRQQTQGWDDSGLLGMAFHPEYGVPGSTNRGHVYIFYQYSCCPIGNAEQRPVNINSAFVSTNRLSRFTISDATGVIDPQSELVLINQRDRNVWHNGGAMFFHPDDGFLYLSLGDEGGADSVFGNDQRIDRSLFAGVIRIDVDQNLARSHPIRRQPVDGQTAHYTIPTDNPFLDPDGGVLEEFWCIGLREPHRMTYDPVTRTIWEGDVGQAAREEINLLERGGNYQWAYREGKLDGPKPKPARLLGEDRLPLHEYGHQKEANELTPNNCVIGGYVYRGRAHAARLAGQYVFGDNGSGRIWALAFRIQQDPSVQEPILSSRTLDQVEVRQIAQMPPGSNYSGLSGFGVDHEGELYLCQMGVAGRIYKLASPLALQPQDLPPPRLSETGLFASLKTLTPAPGLIPYDVNSPLWSDAADKLRWMALPNDGPPYAPEEKIAYHLAREWGFPSGTVFVKHFQLPVDETDNALIRRLETRLLVRDAKGAAYGVTYKWREDQSDADLLLEGVAEEIPIRTRTGTRIQTWSYPSPRDCLACHTPAAGYVLGVRTHQLNGLLRYVSSGVTDHQLRVWDHLDLFEPPLPIATLPQLPRLVAVNDSSATLQERVRSYLAANCAQCHRPGGVRASLDARHETPLLLQGLIGGAVEHSLGLPEAAVVVPGDPARSVLLRRLNLLGENQMPPLARNRIDEAAARTVTHWIRSLPAASSVRGLSAQFFADPDLGELRLTRTDQRINSNWGEGSPAPGTIPTDRFSVRWSGFIQPRFSETYVFETRSDDGVRLWINDELIIDRWSDHAPQLDRGTIALEAGRSHSIKLEYYDRLFGAVIVLYWQSARQNREIVPATALSSLSATVPDFLPPYLFLEEGPGRPPHWLINAEQVGTYEIQHSKDLEVWAPVRRFEQVRGLLNSQLSISTSETPSFYRVRAEPKP